MSHVLHLLPLADWAALAPGAPVVNASLATEGFIHCTDDADVLLRVANSFYRDVPGAFVVLHIDTDRLAAPCVWEAPADPDGAAAPPLAPQFPHVYGPIDRDAVVGVERVVRGDDGQYLGYEPLRD